MTEYYERPQPKPSKELVYLILFWIGGTLASVVVLIILWLIMTGKLPGSIETDFNLTEHLHTSMVIQVVSSIFTFFLPGYLVATFRRGKPMKELGFQSSVKINRLIISIAIMLSVLPLVGYIADFNKWIPVTPDLKKIFDSMELELTEQIKKIAVFNSPLDYVIVLIVIAVTPAIVEEVFFRGSMQQIFRRWFVHPWLVITITSIIFSAIHFSWYGFLPRFALGVVLGYLFFYTQNIWYSIIAHFFNNALSLTFMYLQYRKDQKIKFDEEESVPWWLGVVALVSVLSLLMLFRKMRPSPETKDVITKSSDDLIV